MNIVIRIVSSNKSYYKVLVYANHFTKKKNLILVLHPDRTTPIGKMIDSYLRSQSDLDDRAIHLLFSANRWELACVSSIAGISTFI